MEIIPSSGAVDSVSNVYEQLLRLISDDEQIASSRFLLLRAKLVSYFEGRRITPSEDHADEVLHRIASKISSGEKIEDINRYAYGIARLVRLESYRTPEFVPLEEIDGPESRPRRTPPLLTVVPDPEMISDDGSAGIMQSCLHKCLGELSDNKRVLLLDYYAVDKASGKHKEQRKKIARRQGKTPGALQKQICLLRQKVSECTKKCVGRN